MTIPIILTAFGTTSSAIESYAQIEKNLRPLLGERPIYWSYSSRMVTATLKKECNLTVKTIPQILENLIEEGYDKAVVQSLHLFPGYEFHKTVLLSRQEKIRCEVGTPLLTSYYDFKHLASLLKPQCDEQKDSAILLMGHGTDHPTWTSYAALEKVLRQEIGDNLYVGVVEKFPHCDHLIDQIKKDGYKKVYMLPLFLVAGLHYKRDMIEAENSWKNRLEKAGIDVTSHPHGISLLDGLENLIHSHITEAIEKIDNSSL